MQAYITNIAMRSTTSQISPYYRFVNSLSNSSATQEKYIKELNYYLKYLGITDANTLIYDNLIDSPAEIRQVEDKLIEYIKYLHNVEKLSYSTISVRLAAILCFYTINRINTNRRYVSKFKPQNKKLRKDNAYSHGQILHLLNSSTDLRQKMIILLLASTGMRLGALQMLTVGSLHKIELKPSHIHKIIVYEGERQEYYTFCSFECTAAIDQYLDYRKRFGEVLKSSSPLIREQFDTTDKFVINRPQFLSIGAFRVMMDRILVVSGLRNRSKGKNRNLHEIMRSHGFRKFTITQMKKAQLDFSDREYLVGHKGSRGLDVNYDRTSEEDRLQEYLKAMELLTISPENRLRKQVAEQEHTIQFELAEKDKQIQELVQRQDQLEAWLRNPEQFIRMRDEAFKMGKTK
jgi:integrase